MNDDVEPGLDLSNPEPEPSLPSMDGSQDDQNAKLLEFLSEHQWACTSMQQTAPSMQDIYSYGSASPVRIPAGNGSITLTITVFL